MSSKQRTRTARTTTPSSCKSHGWQSSTAPGYLVCTYCGKGAICPVCLGYRVVDVPCILCCHHGNEQVFDGDERLTAFPLRGPTSVTLMFVSYTQASLF